MKMDRLNLGCNRWPTPGWINVDLRTYTGKPQLYADIRKPLPFRPNTFSKVYCGHILEHLTPEECVVALTHIARVLRPTGILGVVGPDIELATAGYPEAIPDIMHGTGDGLPGEGHEWIPTRASTTALLKSCGWQVHNYLITEMPDHWPIVSRIGWQFAMEARLK